jgi:hypothetical protein
MLAADDSRGAFAFLHKPFYSGDVDMLLHHYGICSPNLASEGTGLVGQFDAAIVRRTISMTHTETGFRDAPHLRLGQVKQNKGVGRFSQHVGAAENAAILELKCAKLLNAAAA